MNVTVGANDTKATILVDILIDSQAAEESEVSESDISQLAIVFEAECAVKEVPEIKAPAKVLTVAEINTLFALLA